VLWRQLVGMQHQPCDAAAFDQMRLQDLVDVLLRFVPVPHALRVDHHVRPILAAVETARGIPADAVDAQLPRLLARVTAQFLDTSAVGGAGSAAAPRMALRPYIRAHEDVALVKELGIGGGICHFFLRFRCCTAEQMAQTAVFWSRLQP